MISRPQNINDWCKLFDHIYGEINKNRPWLHYTTNLSTHICLAISPKYYAGPGDFPWQFAKSLAWLIGIHNSQAKPFVEPDISGFGALRQLGNLLLSEFPNRCPYCGSSPCGCSNKHTSSVRRSNRNSNFLEFTKLVDADSNAAKFTLHKWAETIKGIYIQEAQIPMSYLAGKVAEEFGELVNSLGLYRKQQSQESLGNYCEEFTDLFSRLCVFGNRYLEENKETSRNEPKPNTIDDLVWNVFEHGCPTCYKRHTNGDSCKCEELSPDKSHDLFEGLYGPEDAAKKREGVVINVTTSASAQSSASANAVSLTILSVSEFLKIVSEDREKYPQIGSDADELVAALCSKKIDTKIVKKKGEDIIRNSPAGKRQGYYLALCALLKNVTMTIATQPIAQELQGILTDFGQLISTLNG